MADPDIEQAADQAAATDPVPAQAVEVKIIEAAFGHACDLHGLRCEDCKTASQVIAAAVPLIAADRIARLMKTQAAGVELLKAEVERLTAERDAYRCAAEEHQYPSGLNAREAHEQFGCDCWTQGFNKAEEVLTPGGPQ